MPKESTIQHYSSSTTGNVPAAVDLSNAEFAINIPDEKVFLKNQAGTVISLSQTKDLSGSFAFKNAVASSVNGATGAVTITGDNGSARVSVSGATTTITNRLATVTATGVASFATANFDVASGAVSIKNAGVPNTALANSSVTVSPGTGLGGGGAVALGSSVTLSNTGVLSSNGATGAVTITGDAGSQQVSVSGTTTTITNRLATVSATGVASFNATRFTVSNGAVDLAAAYQITGGVPSVNGATGAITITGDAGSQQVSVSGTTTTITNRLATVSATGVASFATANFDVAAGAVSIKSGGVPNTALANSSFTLRDEIGGTDTISLGDTLTITGGRGIDFLRTGTDTYQISGITATSSALGVASFNTASFTVSSGDVTIKSGGVSNTQLVNSSVTVSPGTGLGGGGAVALGSSVTLSNTGVLSANGATGAVTITGDAGSQQVSVSGTTTTITNRLATVSATGVASFATANFDVAAGAVSIKNVGVPNTALANSSVTVSPGTGLGGGGAVALGSSVTLSNTGVLSANGTTGAITITGDAGSQQVSVSGTTTTITNRLATVTATGVASFNATRFTVSNGAVDLAAAYQITGGVPSVNGATGAITITGDSGSQQVSVSGTTTTITNRLATVTATGVASFATANFDVAAGAVSIKSGGVPNAALVNSSVTVSSGTGLGGGGAVALGSSVTLSNTGVLSSNGATGAVTITGDAGSQQVSVSGTTTTITNRLATVSATGVASFATANFDVAAGAVSIKSGGVPNAALANSSFTLRDEVGGTDTISLGDTLTITGGRGIDFLRTTTDTYQVSGITATSSVLGVASFNTASFTVSSGDVTIKSGGVSNTQLVNSSVTVSPGTGLGGGGAVALGSSVTLSNTGVLSSNGATGAITITGDAGSQQVSVSGATTTITNRLATVTATGVASFATANFDVAAGAVSIKNAGVPNTALANSSVTVSPGTGLGGGGAVALGSSVTLSNTGVLSSNGATGAVTITGDAGSQQVSVSGTTTTITNRLATVTATGVASFNTNDFTVSSGAVSLSNVARTNAANTFTEMQTFSGGLSGNLTGNATTVTVTDTNVGTRFLCMAGGTGQTGIFIDRTTTPLQYTPSLGRVTLQSLQATSAGASTTFSSTSIASTSLLSVSVAESMEFVTSSTNPANSAIYFVTPNGDVAFGDVYQTSTQNAFTVIPSNNIMSYSAASGTNVGKLKFGLNRNGLGWTGQFGYGMELGQDSSRMMRMTRILDTVNDQSATGPTCNATFDLDSNGDLTIKPSGGDLIVSGALTVTGTGLSGNVTINNGLSVVGGATFSSSLAVNGNATLGDAATDTTTIYGSKVVNEFVFNNGTARTVGISWANGNVQLLGGTGSGATGATAIYFTGAPATGSASVTLIVTSGGSMTGNTTFWGGNIKWPGGNKPTLSSNGTPDVISFVTPDAGTTIYGFVGGLNFA